MLDAAILMKNTGESHTLEVSPFSMPTRASSRPRRPAPSRSRKGAVPLAPPVSRIPPRPKAPRSVSPNVPLPPVVLSHYPFAGPFVHWDAVQHRAGLFVLLERTGSSAQPYRLLFLDEAEDLHHAVATLQAKRGRVISWDMDRVVYAVLYTDLAPAARRQIVAKLRAHYQHTASLPAVATPYPAMAHDERHRA
jgi:hypothetical protein